MIKQFLAENKKFLILLGVTLLVATIFQFVNAQAPEQKQISVSSITWCNKNYSPQEWKQVKGSESFWLGKCPERGE